MKFKVLIGTVFLSTMWAQKSQAFQSTVWLSSNTAVSESTQTLCGQFVVNGTTETQRGILHGICINTAGTGNITVFGSSWTAVNSITGVMSTATQQPCNFYDAISPNGLSVNKVGPADVSILYQCY